MTSRARTGPRWRRRWLCDWLGWHSAGEIIGYDGCSMRVRCRRCGYLGLIDSQGNLF